MKRLLILTLLAFSQIASAAAGFAPDLPTKGMNLVDVIIKFNHPPNNNDVNQLWAYGQVKHQFPTINSIHLQLPAMVIPFLKYVPGISYVAPNRKLKGALDITTQTVKANLAWSLGWTGAGVGVAVIDSGIANRPDLTDAYGRSRVVYRQDFVAINSPDDYGHGTHVAGIIGSSGKASTGPSYSRTYKGVAPNVNLIDLRVLDQSGAGTDSDVISAIQTAIALKNTYNIRVINLSMGRPVFESYTQDPLCQAVEAAWQAGIVVVVAAGNYGRDNTFGTNGYGTIASPGNDPYVITVGATSSKGTPYLYDDTIASYSSKGPTLFDHIVKPDIVAPGNAVTSLLASTTATLYSLPQTPLPDSAYMLNAPSNVNSSDYFVLSGTSMATPVVSGAAAILIQKNPSLNPDQVKARLMKTAAKSTLPPLMQAFSRLGGMLYHQQSDIFTIGAGYLDINAALASTDLASAPALSPTAVYDAVTHKVYIVRPFGVVWGDGVTWADSVVFGPSVFTGLLNKGYSIIWGSDDSLGVVWGDSTNNAFSTLWATDDSLGVVWGDTINASAADDGDQ